DSPSAYQPRTGCRTGQTPQSAHRLRTDGRTGQIPIRLRTRTSTGRLRESDSLRTGFGRARRSARLPSASGLVRVPDGHKNRPGPPVHPETRTDSDHPAPRCRQCYAPSAGTADIHAEQSRTTDAPLLRGLRVLVLDLDALLLQSLPDHPERSEEHTSELQSRENLVCRLLL